MKTTLDTAVRRAAALDHRSVSSLARNQLCFATSPLTATVTLSLSSTLSAGDEDFLSLPNLYRRLRLGILGTITTLILSH